MRTHSIGCVALRSLFVLLLLHAGACSGTGSAEDAGPVLPSDTGRSDTAGSADTAGPSDMRDGGRDGPLDDAVPDAVADAPGDTAPDVSPDGGLDVLLGGDADVETDGRDGSAHDGGDAPDGSDADAAGDGAPDVQPCECGDGPCCDGCRLRPAGTVCDPAAEREQGCPWGVRCGSDAGVRDRARLCSGTSAACDGPLAAPGVWRPAQACEAPEGCVDGACAPTATCEGAACPEARCPTIDGAAGSCNEATGHCEYALAPETGRWVLITPGAFEMGAAEGELYPWPQPPPERHPVTLTRPYLLRRTELTREEWETPMLGWPITGGSPVAYGEQPIFSVTWFEAVAWCNARSRAEGLEECYRLENCVGAPGDRPDWEPCSEEPPWCRWPRNFRCDAPDELDLDCTGYRLPTEAEWEYACRAGSPTELPTGEVWGGDSCDAPEIDALAWFAGNIRSPPLDYGFLCNECPDEVWGWDSLPCGPQRGGFKAANGWGLHDMLGNVHELVHDASGRYPTEAVTDPVAPRALDPPLQTEHGLIPWEMGQRPVWRGGSFENLAIQTRCTWRDSGSDRWEPGAWAVGFRPARSVP